MLPAVCKVQGARCKVLCNKLRSYAVTLFEVTRVRCKTLEGSPGKKKAAEAASVLAEAASVLVVDSASVLSATCVDPCTVCYDILNLPQRVRVRPDANHCARFIVPGCNEPSATEYPFTIT